ncbi:MAG: hypothetical protein HOQ02_11745 [Lysobacter sp.]|nr:hypothetical protein [Lysobacter sp.]
MSRLLPLFVPLVLAASVVLAAPAAAQSRSRLPKAVVSIYRIAPGHQLEFLKWMAARDAVDREVGVAPTQWYAHLDGDSWDYVGIAPDVDAATDDRREAAAAKHGLTTGMRASLELRQHMATHTDTIAAGPLHRAAAGRHRGQVKAAA